MPARYMSERDKERFVWAPKEELARILHTDVVTYPHPSWGTEHRFTLRSRQNPRQALAKLLTYPERLLVIYRDDDTTLSMHRVSYLGRDPENEGGVRVESITDNAVTTFAMSETGEIFFHRQLLVSEPREAAE